MFKSVVYLQGDKSIRADEEEKDLGVFIHQSMKSTNHCVTAVKSANKSRGMISRTFVNKDTRIMLKLVIGQAQTRILCASMEAVFKERY